MKLSTRHIMRAFRLYGLADDETPLKSLRNLKATDNKSWVKIELIHQNARFVVFWGSLIDEELIEEQLAGVNAQYHILPNPLDPSDAITPFQGKFIAIARLNVSAMRLDTYLATEFDATRSRSQWQKHIKAGHILVNDRACMSPKHEVTLDDEVRFECSDLAPTTHDISIMYQDDDVVVFDKPAGMLTHAKGGIVAEQTVADVLCPLTRCEGDRAGIVHRLDRDTSGVIIGARTPEAERWLQHQFASRQAVKVYLAIIDGIPHNQEALIDLPIGRNPARPSTFRVDSKGKPAQTRYQIIEQTETAALVRLTPTTGRTHQLRVHMAYLGTPIRGDRVYGSSADRLYLHAMELTINLPSGVTKTFHAKVPSEFESALLQTGRL